MAVTQWAAVAVAVAAVAATAVAAVVAAVAVAVATAVSAAVVAPPSNCNTFRATTGVCGKRKTTYPAKALAADIVGVAAAAAAAAAAFSTAVQYPILQQTMILPTPQARAAA